MESQAVFTPEMKNTHTILIPSMLPWHFNLLRAALVSCGYKAEVLDNTERNVVETGLKYVNNDICYPALLVIGQLIDALESGNYDVNKVALILTQTGGGCRASNYIHLLRKALAQAGFAH
ncbi:MAG: 2-hydroxyacyl-CoA dehydratase, partial [Phascolarctobacterium sp.]|nr:2-hydroxyacyl-CoA dehydratase [Phascolarctobacterium sp.]